MSRSHSFNERHSWKIPTLQPAPLARALPRFVDNISLSPLTKADVHGASMLDMQHDQRRTAHIQLTTLPKSDTPKRMVAGLHAELALGANGKALRHDRLDPWEQD